MMKIEVRIVFAGGGTGGHVFPAIYLAQYLKKYMGANCLFIGTKNGMESRKVPQAGFVLKYIWISGFHRRLDLRNLIFPLKLIISLWQSKKELRQFKPDLVIGTGGYVSGPVLYQAVKMKIPTVIQEQNSFPGVTTRFLASKVNFVFVAYNEALQYLNGVSNSMVVGNPVKNNLGLVDKVIARQFFGIRKNIPTVLVFGGSQGSRNINKAISELVGKGVFSKIQLIWQTGENEFSKYKSKFEKSINKNIHLIPFIDKMEYAYAISDIAICRAGAMTIAELAAAGLPPILVPLSSAAANHQHKNAKSLSDQGAALLIKDDNQLALQLERSIKKLISNRDLRQKMAVKIKKFHSENATSQIAEQIKKILNGKF